MFFVKGGKIKGKKWLNCAETLNSDSYSFILSIILFLISLSSGEDLSPPGTTSPSENCQQSITNLNKL